MTRKEQLQEIEERLKNGVEEYFTSEKYASLLRIMSKFHNYSFNNCILIATQCPQASFVTGYSNWKTSFNRIVKRGEKAIRIIAPCPYTKVNEEKGEEEKRIFFRTTSVFDLSQTIQIPNTEEVQFGIEELTGDVPDYERLLNAIIATSTCPVSYKKPKGSVKGYYAPLEKKIVVCEGMSELQTIKTLLHEIAHSLLHNPEEMEERKVRRDTKEVEAESTAFIVATLLGLDTSDYSFEYIAGWNGKDNLKALSAAMKQVQDTANQMYDNIIQQLDRVA